MPAATTEMSKPLKGNLRLTVADGKDRQTANSTLTN